MSCENHRIPDKPLDLPDLAVLVVQRIRAEILVSLAHSPKDVTTLANDRDVAIDTISHHLRRLRGAQLVVFDRVGARKVYRLGPRVLCTVRDNVVHLVVDTPEHHELELRFPFNSSIEWYHNSAFEPTYGRPRPEQTDSA